MNGLERKLRLKHGDMTRIAKRLNVSLSHVSRVVAADRTGRRDPRVEREVARRIGRPVEDVFPASLFTPARYTDEQIKQLAEVLG